MSLIVLKPRMSEKAYALSQSENTFVFDVPLNANKATVTDAVTKQFKVTVEDGVLKVEGGHQVEHEEKGKEYFRREIRRGQFVRMLSLPVSVKEGEAKAAFEHGVLKVTLPKTEAAKPKVVEVEVK